MQVFRKQNLAPRFKNLRNKVCSIASTNNNLKRLKNIIHTIVRRCLEETLDVKTFLKMSIGFKCRGPEVELRFCTNKAK